MMYFLDTNMCIYFLNGKYEGVRDKIIRTPPSNIKISSIVKAELLFGCEKSKKRKENREKVEGFLEPFEIVPFEDPMSYLYAKERRSLEERGKSIGPNDLLIAVTAKHHGGTLVTNNVKEFENVKGLKIENWAV